MTQEEKDLLLKDLCARLPYRVKVRRIKHTTCTDTVESIETFNSEWLKEFYTEGVEFKPYLRPLSSMTKEEREYVEELSNFMATPSIVRDKTDFYLEHHLDYRGLMSIGLALKAKEGMYKIE